MALTSDTVPLQNRLPNIVGSKFDCSRNLISMPNRQHVIAIGTIGGEIVQGRNVHKPPQSQSSLPPRSHMPSLSRSTILTSLVVLFFSIYMLPNIFKTASNRLAPLARKSILTSGAATTAPLAGFSLFNLGNTASFGSMGRNDINNDEAPLDPKVVKQDTEWRAQLSPEQVSAHVHIVSRRRSGCLLFRARYSVVPSLEAEGNRGSRYGQVQQAQGGRSLQ